MRSTCLSTEKQLMSMHCAMTSIVSPDSGALLFLCIIKAHIVPRLQSVTHEDSSWYKASRYRAQQHVVHYTAAK